VVPRYGDLRRLGAPAAMTDGARVVAVAGIARPHRFFSALGERGFDVARQLTFRDHHWFSAADIVRISAVAHDVGAASIVTTEKDAVRVEPLV
jgi:tetraacyldisaccharide 4'-kinase